MATHFSILAQRIPWAEEHTKELDTTEVTEYTFKLDAYLSLCLFQISLRLQWWLNPQIKARQPMQTLQGDALKPVLWSLTCCCQVASVVSDSVWPYRQQPTRLLHPWESPGKNTGVGCHFLLQRMKVKSESEVAQSCLTLSNPMDCRPPGSSIHGIFQARVLEWGAIAFSQWWV